MCQWLTAKPKEQGLHTTSQNTDYHISTPNTNNMLNEGHLQWLGCFMLLMFPFIVFIEQDYNRLLKIVLLYYRRKSRKISRILRMLWFPVICQLIKHNLRLHVKAKDMWRGLQIHKRQQGNPAAISSFTLKHCCILFCSCFSLFSVESILSKNPCKNKACISANASHLEAVSSAATGEKRDYLHRNALRDERKAWLLAAGAASAVQKAKNNQVPWTSVITTHHYSSCLHRTADNSENSDI